MESDMILYVKMIVAAIIGWKLGVLERKVEDRRQIRKLKEVNLVLVIAHMFWSAYLNCNPSSFTLWICASIVLLILTIYLTNNNESDKTKKKRTSHIRM